MSVPITVFHKKRPRQNMKSSSVALRAGISNSSFIRGVRLEVRGLQTTFFLMSVSLFCLFYLVTRDRRQHEATNQHSDLEYMATNQHPMTKHKATNHLPLFKHLRANPQRDPQPMKTN